MLLILDTITMSTIVPNHYNIWIPQQTVVFKEGWLQDLHGNREVVCLSGYGTGLRIHRLWVWIPVQAVTSSTLSLVTGLWLSQKKHCPGKLLQLKLHNNISWWLVRLGSMILLQLAFLRESNPLFPSENPNWDNKAYKIQKKELLQKSGLNKSGGLSWCGLSWCACGPSKASWWGLWVFCGVVFCQEFHCKL